jgi:hypothetical protein
MLFSVQKQKFHKQYDKVLKKLAKDLKLKDGTYEIRHSYGGFSVFGDLVLHAEKLYVCIVGSLYRNSKTFYYRACNGLNDYKGSPNQYMDLEAFKDKHALLSVLRECIATGV